MASLAEKLSKNIHYLALTPVEQLYDEGVVFEGQDLKEQMLMHDDFCAARGIFTRLAAQHLSEDERTFLLRSMRLTIKDECFK